MFTRSVLHAMIWDLQKRFQIFSITGPRRIGKSSLLRRIIRHLLGERLLLENLMYDSQNDPALFRSRLDCYQFMEALMLKVRRRGGWKRVFLFLEGHRVEDSARQMRPDIFRWSPTIPRLSGGSRKTCWTYRADAPSHVAQ